MNGMKKNRKGRRSARAGQAIAELVVGLIAILVVLMCMLQIQALALSHTQALNVARAQAGGDAIASPYILRNAVMTWISDTSPGNDKIRYSQDDTPVTGDPGFVTSDIVAHANPDTLSHYAPNNELSTAATTTGLMNELYLTHGRQQNQVAILPLVKALVYGTDYIQIQGDAWLSWTHIENVK